MSTVFEPLVADWQREWQDGAAARLGRWCELAARRRSHDRHHLDATDRAGAPADTVRRPGHRHVLLYCALSVVIQGALTYVTWRSTAPPPSAWLCWIPALFTALLPFAMVAGVDAIRRHDAWPEHVQRRAAFKLVAVATVWMVLGGGWIAPATNRQWQAP